MIKNNFLFTGLLGAAVFFSSSLNAQCTPVSEFSENFDALSCCSMGVVPPCWNSILTQNGNQIISHTSPASGTSNVYQTGYGKTSIVVMPPLTNINAGTHHFKFKARVSAGSGAGLLDFGYITDINDMSTFVILQSITIANGTYDNTSERILDVPATVPSTARLAIRNPGTTWAGHYWDDAVWENKSNLAVHDTKLTENKVFPNPFTSVINISDADKIRNIMITDVSGRLLKKIENPSSQIAAGDLKSGIYFLTLQFKDGRSQSVKAVKE